ncbi:hypothetical protein [Caballeronia sp. S22]|uniref:hypothetical protein n=1 Tax=Caballeronia sp. S22 TaxID=3137182 RepID=UPI0035316E77
MSDHVSGTAGYIENASQHIERWQKISYQQLHGGITHLIPPAPANVLDVAPGAAGTLERSPNLGTKLLQSNLLMHFAQQALHVIRRTR